MDRNKTVVRRLIEEINRRNLAVIDELVSEDYVNHDIFPGEPTGREGVKKVLGLFLTAFPDLQETTVRLIAEGELVVHQWRSRATHRGEFRGIPATGREVSMNGIEIFRVRNGQITERWGLADSLGLLRQLGAVVTTRASEVR